jgi:uncharacterized protein
MSETNSRRMPGRSTPDRSTPSPGTPCVAFAGHTCVASGSLSDVVRQVKSRLDAGPATTVLILDACTSEPVEVDLRGTTEEVAARLEATRPEPGRTPGRPRLGVVAREVTLLPRHWEWLSEQPGGASVTLRRLVEEARRSTADQARVRRAQEACYRFMNTVAGNEPGFEEALRALYAGDQPRFAALTEAWPPDVRDHARRLAAGTFGDPIPQSESGG